MKLSVKTGNNLSIFTDPLIDKNPLTYLVMGFCSALAVTVKVETAVVMTAAVVFVLAISNTVISVIRKMIPSKVRIITQLAIISSMVIVTDQFLKAYLYDVSKQLSVFVALIITNCIIFGRTEGFAMHNTPGKSFLDGLGNAFGYGIGLITVAIFRELLGSGSIYGFTVVPEWLYEAGYSNATLIVLAPGAFFILGLLIWAIKAIQLYQGKSIDNQPEGHVHST